MKRRKKTNKDKLREEAERIWKVKVIKKARGLCEICGDPAVVAHHFFPRSVSAALRFELDNGVALCQKHHMAHHISQDPSIHLLIRANRGKRWLNKLEKNRYNDTLWTDKYYQEQIDRLKKL